jgi:hypothetical protein
MGNKGQIAGVLSIVSGVLAIIGAIVLIAAISLIGTILETATIDNGSTYPFDVESFVSVFYGTTGAILAILGIFSIIGGVFSIKRKYWGLGLAAAIVSIITFFPCGIAATVIIAMGKSEFDRPLLVSSTVQPPPVVPPPTQP